MFRRKNHWLLFFLLNKGFKGVIRSENMIVGLSNVNFTFYKSILPSQKGVLSKTLAHVVQDGQHEEPMSDFLPDMGEIEGE